MLVDIEEVAKKLSDLVERLENGSATEVIICRAGTPVAKLIPFEAPPRSKLRIGLLAGRYPSFSLEDFNSSDAEIAALFLSDDE